MKLQHHGAILFLSVFFQTVVFHLPKLTYGNEISDATKYNIIIENNQDVQDRLNLQMRFTSRSLENDDTCANACEAESVSSFKVTIQPGSLMLDTEDEDATGSRGYRSSLTGFFYGTQHLFGRLMNNLFKIFNQSKDDDLKYMISTEYILPFLSTYSTKFKSLAAMIRQESKSDAALSTTPDAIQMMYNISAMNMEAVATVLDPIMDDMRQSKTIDIRTMSCNIMSILTLLRDVTIPNIQTITKLICTNSNNEEMKDKFNEYTTGSTGTAPTQNKDLSTPLTGASSTGKRTCPDASGRGTSARLFGDDGLVAGLFQFLFDTNVDVGPIGHIVSILLLIVLFPFSIVLSFTVLIFLILRSLVDDQMMDETDDDSGNYLEGLFFVLLIGAPLVVIWYILRNISGFFEDILDPFLPETILTPAPVTFSPTYPPPTTGIITRFPGLPAPKAPSNAPLVLRANAPRMNPPATVRDAQRASDIVSHLSVVLESPIDTIVDALQNVNRFSDSKEEIDCEMAILTCKNDALIDILPF